MELDNYNTTKAKQKGGDALAQEKTIIEMSLL